MSSEQSFGQEETSPRLRMAYLAICFLGLMLIAIASTVMGPAFPLILKEFAVPFGILGFLASALNLGYITTPAGGILSDRYGEPIVLMIGLLAAGVAVGLASAATDYPALILLFLITGTGAAFAEVAMNSLVTKFYPHKSGFALNVLHLFFSMGAFLGPVLAGALITTYGSWRPPYLISGVSIALLTILVVLLTRGAGSLRRARETAAGETGSSRDDFASLLLQGRPLLVAGFFYFCVEQGANAWLPSFLIFERGFPIELASLSIGLFWASMAAGRFALGSMADRAGYRRLITVSALLGTLSISVAILTSETYTIIALWCLTGFVFGPIMPSIFAWTARLFPTRR